MSGVISQDWLIHCSSSCAAGPTLNVLLSFAQFEPPTLVYFNAMVQKQCAALYLIFENNFDGPLDAYLADLYRQAANGLHQIY